MSFKLASGISMQSLTLGLHTAIISEYNMFSYCSFQSFGVPYPNI